MKTKHFRINPVENDTKIRRFRFDLFFAPHVQHSETAKDQRVNTEAPFNQHLNEFEAVSK